MKALNRWKVLLALTVCIAMIGIGCNPKPADQKLGASYYPGTLTSALPNYAYSPMKFTATAQTDTQALSGVGWATVELYGVATAETIQCKGSNDGGTNYFGIPYSDGTITATYNTVKMIAAGTWSYTGTPLLYYVNLSGFTNLSCTTSSTFTGASAYVQVTASSNPGLL